ncbi:AAA family ATPase [Occultella kanbiaonis]|uniref:AAA family ATPase n=1 Tax=Occultella kanbiaonis TaxID=2675754 RepID=UPI0012BA1F1D|nr:P-loop NTPase [Occultella kanbiaonis]
MRTGVLLCLRGEVEQALVAAIAAAPGLSVVRRCADTAELLAAALAGLGSVAVVDADFEVDRPLISRLRAAGTRTLVLCDPDAVDRHTRLGALAVAPDGDLLGAVTALADGADDDTDRTAERFDAVIGAGWDDPGGPSADVPQHGPTAEPTEPGAVTGAVADSGEGAPGRVVVVWGPSGAPGRTTIAVNLAAELAAAGEPTLLVDADIWGASVAQVLGVLDEFAGLAAAVRAADHGTLDAAALARLTPWVSQDLRVLPGLARPGRWREVSGASLDVLWDQARRLSRWVVIDAPVLVPDDESGFDLGPARNAVAASAFSAADELVVVGAAEPIGVERLVQALLDLDDVAPTGLSRTVLVNRVRATAAGPRAAASVGEALARFAGVSDPVLVPDDRPMCDRALLAGTAWAEAAPRSAAREVVRDVARALRDRAGQGARAPGRRWWSGRGRGLRADRVGVARTLRGQ